MDEDIDYTKYSIQLHVYRYILQTYYGLTIPSENLYMVVFHPKNDSYIMYRAKDMSGKIPWLFEKYGWCVAQCNASKDLEERYKAWALEPDMK